MKIGNRALGMGCGLDDGWGIVMQNPDPARDIAGVIRAGLKCKAKIGGKESCPKLGHQFLAGITFVAPFLTAKAAIKAGLVAGLMHGFMASRRVISSGFVESGKGRKLNAVG